MKRKIPKFASDEQAEAFLNQDLSDLDFSQFKPTRFEFQKKTAQINMRIPKALLEAVKRRSAARGIPIPALFAKPLNRRFIAPKNRDERRVPLLVILAATSRPGCLGTISLLLYCIRSLSRDARNARSNQARTT